MTEHDLRALVGCTIDRVGFDYQVRLQLHDGLYPDERVVAELVVETPFRLGIGSVWHTIEPGVVSTLAPVLNLFTHKIVAAQYKDRILSISFDGGLEMAVPTSREFETWNLTGRGVPQILVAMED